MSRFCRLSWTTSIVLVSALTASSILQVRTAAGEDGVRVLATTSVPARERPESTARGMQEVVSASPLDVRDLAFKKYVDYDLLMQAYARMDAALLADAGMQLAEGERILLRSHKRFPADAIFGLAVKAAVEKKDKATLDRLAKIADKRDSTALKTQIVAAQKLGSQSRAIDSALLVSLDEVTPGQFLIYRDMVRELQRARILGDRKAVEQLEKAIKEMTALPEKKREYLLNVISESLAAMPKDCAKDPMVSALGKLVADSRGGFLGQVSGAYHHAAGQVSGGYHHAAGQVSGGYHHAAGQVSAGYHHAAGQISGGYHHAAGQISAGYHHAAGQVGVGVQQLGNTIGQVFQNTGGDENGDRQDDDASDNSYGQTDNDSNQSSDGTGPLNDGSNQFSDGSEQASDGSDQSSDGSEQASDGSDQSSDGSDQSSDGMYQSNDGTDQLGDDDSEQSAGQDDEMQLLSANSRSTELPRLSPLSSLRDPAFNRQIDLVLLARAVETMDAVLLADMGLQFAEGERILLRSHKAFSADAILALAVKAAVEKKDKATLDRLAKIADKRDSAALKIQIAAAQKLSSQSRAIDFALVVSLDEGTPEQFLVYHKLLLKIPRARILGDREVMEKLEKAIKKDAMTLPEKKREYLLKVISESLVAMPKDCATDPMASALVKLVADSRGGFLSQVSDAAKHAGGEISKGYKHTAGQASVGYKQAAGHASAGYKHAAGQVSGGYKHAVNESHRLATNLSDQAWGVGGRIAFPAAAAIMAARYSQRAHKSLSRHDRAVLAPYFGNDTTTNVGLVWGTTPLNEWRVGIMTVNLGGAEAQAQTYGYVVYIRGAPEDYSDEDRLSLLIHELTHVKQYEQYGRRLDNFGYHYFKAYKQANQNYENNELEQKAYGASERLTPSVLAAYVQRMGKLNGSGVRQ